ncbi:MAG: hypothetical protein ACRDNO_09490 [Trebonia sp.]
MTSDYASFGYLEDEPAAFARLPLATESGRVPAYDGGFDAATVARAESLLAQHVVVSLHDHPVRFPADMAFTPQYNRTGRQHTAFEGLAASGLTVVFDNMMDSRRVRHGKHPVAVGRRGDGPGHAPGGHRPPGSRGGRPHPA